MDISRIWHTLSISLTWKNCVDMETKNQSKDLSRWNKIFSDIDSKTDISKKKKIVTPKVTSKNADKAQDDLEAQRN